MHFMYTRGVAEYYNHAGQFDDMFPALRDPEAITTHYMAECDHVA